MNDADFQTHYKNGLKAISNRDYCCAIDEFLIAIEIDPNHAEAHQELGWLTYGSDGPLSQARWHLETALQINPGLGDAHMYLGIVLHRFSEIHESETHFRKALELSDDPAIVHSTFAEEVLWHNSRYGEAEEHFLAAIELSPQLVLAIRDYARMLTCHGRDAEAQRLFNLALDIDPNDRHTKRAYEEFLQETTSAGRDPDECLREAVDIDPAYVRGIAALNNRLA